MTSAVKVLSLVLCPRKRCLLISSSSVLFPLWAPLIASFTSPLPCPLSLSPPTLEHCGSTSTCRPDVPRSTQGLLQLVLFLLLATLQAVCLKQIYQEKDESLAQSQAHGGSVIFDVTKHKPPTSGGHTDQGAIFWLCWCDHLDFSQLTFSLQQMCPSMAFSSSASYHW